MGVPILHILAEERDNLHAPLRKSDQRDSDLRLGDTVFFSSLRTFGTRWVTPPDWIL
jgi:hypothetical protein